MSDLVFLLRPQRERVGLSQQALAKMVGVSRQALSAIEAGRQVPSTRLSLLLARALQCSVEDLFALADAESLPVVLPEATDHGRVVLGRVAGRWVAHPLAADSPSIADGILLPGGRVQPLVAPSRMERSLLVAGCAPLLGLLSQRTSLGDVSVRWLSASSGRALDLLDAGLIHVAGLHFFDADSGSTNLATVRRRFAGQAMSVVNFVCWRQGLLVAPGNPLGLSGVGDLCRPGLRFARRGPGAGARKLVQGVLGDEALSGPMARGPVEVAHLIRAGAADAGVAIEAAAIASGLDFLPMSEERFDLVYPTALADDPALCRLMEGLYGHAFRTEVSHIPGYDLSRCGTTEAA